MRGLSNSRAYGVRLWNMSNMENFLGMLSEQLGAKISINTTVLNPTYPLKFERFGDGKLEDDAEFQSHVKELSTQGHDVAIEFASDKRFYSCSKIYKAEKMARKAYVEDDPVAAVRKALKISPYCPEAYNVMAQFQANTYEEALEFYNKAVELAPNVSAEFEQELPKRRAWSLNHLRSYFRAVHGQANTLRKMGRYEESLEKYLQLEKLDPAFYSWCSYANWRYHVLEIYMKLGDDRGALKFAMKKSNVEGFQFSSSCGAWFWTKALLDYRYKQHRGYAEDFYDAVIDRNDPESQNVFNSFEGTILRAFQASPETLSFLTGERKLPDCLIPVLMGNWRSLTNVATYCLSYAELWRNTPGALEWAASNARTFMCSMILDQDKENCKRLGIPCTAKKFKELLSQGIFFDAKVNRSSKTLVHCAVCGEMPQYLQMLLDAGANVKIVPRGGRGIPQPLHMACYYSFSSEIIQILCKAGADPTDKCGFHYSPLQMAAEQGGLRALKAAFDCLPDYRKKDQKVLDSILLAVFQSSCYECVTGLGDLCQRCLGGDGPHRSDATWIGVLDFLTELNYKPSKKYLDSMQEFPKKKKLFAYYVCKLRGEEPKEAAEGPDLRRRPLSLTQPSSLSTFLSALGQFGDLPSQLQKQLQSTRAIMPKSVKSMCENCKGSERKMMVCGQCHQAYYCSRECQKKDWKQHKKSCATRKE